MIAFRELDTQNSPIRPNGMIRSLVLTGRDLLTYGVTTSPEHPTSASGGLEEEGYTLFYSFTAPGFCK